MNSEYPTMPIETVVWRANTNTDRRYTCTHLAVVLVFQTQASLKILRHNGREQPQPQVQEDSVVGLVQA